MGHEWNRRQDKWLGKNRNYKGLFKEAMDDGMTKQEAHEYAEHFSRR